MDSSVKWHPICILPGDVLVSFLEGTKVACRAGQPSACALPAHPRIPVQSHCHRHRHPRGLYKGKGGKQRSSERAIVGMEKGQVGFGKENEG